MADKITIKKTKNTTDEEVEKLAKVVQNSFLNVP